MTDAELLTEVKFEGTGLMFRHFRNALEVVTDNVKAVIWRMQ